MAEIVWASVTWQWSRGYVYAGSSLLAVQQNGVFFIHEDPVTKSKRVTDMSGNVQSAVELDPYGADTTRSSNASFQPRKFTSYERDANGTDEAMFRRYNRWHLRFDQPDPYDGSYDFTDRQSFNRYSYTQGDPANLIDPTGLDFINAPPEPHHAPDSLFGDYFIDAWRNGWGQMYGLNPISMTFETSHGTFGEDGSWTEYTTFTLWPHGRAVPQKPSPTPAPTPEKTLAQKQKEYQECYHEEMKPAMKQLNDLMDQNLALTALSALPGGGIASLINPTTRPANITVWGLMDSTLRSISAAQVGIGTSLSILPALYNWYRELKNFDRDVFTPAMKKAAEDCKKKAGL